MLKLLRMQRYWISRAKFAWVILIIGAVISVFTTVIVNIETQMAKQAYSYSQKVTSQDEDVSVGLSMDSSHVVNEAVFDQLELDALVEQVFSSGFILLLVGIFAVRFTICEIKNGYIKNLTCHMKTKSSYIFAKAIMIVVYSVLICVCALLFTTIAYSVLFSYFNIGSYAHILRLVVMYALMSSAMGIFAMFITTLFRSTAFPATIVVLCSSGFSTTLFYLLTSLLSDYLPEDFTFTDYLITGCARELSINMDSSIILRAAIVAVCYCAGSIGLSALLMNKRDIK